MWQRYTQNLDQHTVVGDLRVYRDFYSPQLENRRDVLVWLPDSYESSSQRYPVVYMHDGRNLFDAHTSYSGEWQVDETMQMLSAEGYEAMVVGLPNAGEFRRSEYNPYPPGSGDAYLKFIVETVKPMIDAEFRTLTDAPHTGIAGSSMGGLISLYGFLKYPQIFGFCGAFSTAYWFGENGLAQTVLAEAKGQGKIYLDVGTREGETLLGFPELGNLIMNNDPDQSYVDGVRQLREGLLKKGYSEPTTLLYVEEIDAPHRESAWARRLPDALRFLLPK